MYTFTDEDVKLVEKFIQIKNKGYYCSGTELTTVYNRVLHKNVPSTSCGSCIRARITELETALQSFKKTMAVNAKEEENKAPQEAQNKPKGRPRKTQS